MKPRRSVLAAKPRTSRLLLLLLAVAALGLLIGCAYGTLPPRIVRGNDFSVEAAKSIKEGDSADTVRAILGEPLSVERRHEGEFWRYYARERKDGVTYILGFIPKRTPHFIWDYELQLVIRNGLVHKAHYTEIKIK